MIGINSTLLWLLGISFFIYVMFRLRFSIKEASLGKASRLSRIKKVSYVVQCLLLILLPLGLYSFAAFIFGWPQFPSTIKVFVAPGHVFSSAAEVPPSVLPLWVVQQLLNFWGGVMMLRLFWLYGQGILFSAKNVICIRFFGWLLIINWFIDLQIHSHFRDYGLSSERVTVGLLIIFVAWIMDEGRKIQEEQELTV